MAIKNKEKAKERRKLRKYKSIIQESGRSLESELELVSLLRNDVKEDLQKEKKYGHKNRKIPNADFVWDRFHKFLEYCHSSKKPYTLERLCLFLGIDKQQIKEYTRELHSSSGKEDKDIREALLKIRRFIISDKVERLNSSSSVAGIIFDLKNNEGWSDRVDHKVSGEITFMDKLKDAISKSKEV